jgi:hypothetical protein
MMKQLILRKEKTKNDRQRDDRQRHLLSPKDGAADPEKRRRHSVIDKKVRMDSFILLHPQDRDADEKEEDIK